MTENMKKTVDCSECGKHIECEGKPGKKIVITCPKCKAKVSVFFSKRENNEENKQKHKPHATDVTKKQLAGYGIAGILALLFIFGVILPVLQGNLHFLVVLSESMKPNINMGDVVVTTATKPEDIQVGDVITFRQPTKSNPNRCVTHRVINITNENPSISFQTKGDATEDPDMEPVKSSDLVGKVLLSIPYIGYIPHHLKTPLGFILLIIVPGSLIITSEVWNIIRTKRGVSEKKKVKRRIKSSKKKESEEKNRTE